MNDEFKAIEKQLKKLVPVDQEALAAKILDPRQSANRDHAIPSPSAPRRRRWASFSISSAVVGAMLGAAATFLAMMFLVPPKVEISQTAHETHATAEPVSNPPHSLVRMEEPAAKKLDERPTPRLPSFRELDALLAEQEARARRLTHSQASFDFASSGSAPPRISPEQYREILRDLKL